MCKIPSQNQPICEEICPVPIKLIIEVKDTLCIKYGVLFFVQKRKVTVQNIKGVSLTKRVNQEPSISVRFYIFPEQ